MTLFILVDLFYFPTIEYNVLGTEIYTHVEQIIYHILVLLLKKLMLQI
jgi:hypothetical protein